MERMSSSCSFCLLQAFTHQPAHPVLTAQVPTAFGSCKVNRLLLGVQINLVSQTVATALFVRQPTPLAM
jgi:hypothetical protein